MFLIFWTDPLVFGFTSLAKWTWPVPVTISHYKLIILVLKGTEGRGELQFVFYGCSVAWNILGLLLYWGVTFTSHLRAFFFKLSGKTTVLSVAKGLQMGMTMSFAVFQTTCHVLREGFKWLTVITYDVCCWYPVAVPMEPCSRALRHVTILPKPHWNPQSFDHMHWWRAGYLC